MFRGRGFLVLAVLAATCAAEITPCRASALDLFGFGGRLPALAGTGTSYADTYDALYANPAGLAYARRKRLTVGFMGGTMELRRGGRDIDPDKPLGVIVAGDAPIPFGGALTDRVTMAIGLHVPPLLLSQAYAPFPGDPYLTLLESRSQVVTLMVGIGARITPKLSLGIGTIALAALGGGIDVAADRTKRFTSSAEQQLLIDYAPLAGVRYQATPKLALGAVVRDQSIARYDILVTNDIGDALPVTLPPIRVRGIAQFDPLMATVEGSYVVRPSLIATAGVTWKHWSGFTAPTEDPIIDAPERPRADFSDTVVPRLAVRWRARTGVEVRAGYAFEPTPAPDQTGKENLLDNHRNILSAGVGLEMCASGVPMFLDLWTQAHLLVSRTHTKDQTLPPGERDPVWLEISSSGQIYVGGFTFGVNF